MEVIINQTKIGSPKAQNKRLTIKKKTLPAQRNGFNKKYPIQKKKKNANKKIVDENNIIQNLALPNYPLQVVCDKKTLLKIGSPSIWVKHSPNYFIH